MKKIVRLFLFLIAGFGAQLYGMEGGEYHDPEQTGLPEERTDQPTTIPVDQPTVTPSDQPTGPAEAPPTETEAPPTEPVDTRGPVGIGAADKPTISIDIDAAVKKIVDVFTQAGELVKTNISAAREAISKLTVQDIQSFMRSQPNALLQISAPLIGVMDPAQRSAIVTEITDIINDAKAGATKVAEVFKEGVELAIDTADQALEALQDPKQASNLVNFVSEFIDKTIQDARTRANLLPQLPRVEMEDIVSQLQSLLTRLDNAALEAEEIVDSLKTSVGQAIDTLRAALDPALQKISKTLRQAADLVSTNVSQAQEIISKLPIKDIQNLIRSQPNALLQLSAPLIGLMDPAQQKAVVNGIRDIINDAKSGAAQVAEVFREGLDLVAEAADQALEAIQDPKEASNLVNFVSDFIKGTIQEAKTRARIIAKLAPDQLAEARNKLSKVNDSIGKSVKKGATTVADALRPLIQVALSGPDALKK